MIGAGASCVLSHGARIRSASRLLVASTKGRLGILAGFVIDVRLTVVATRIAFGVIVFTASPMLLSERGKRSIVLDDTMVALLVRMGDQFLHVVAGAPTDANVDLSLVRLPDDWLMFPAPDGQFSEPRHPDSVTKQFTKRAEKILGFSIRTPVHVVAKRLGHDP